MNDCIKRIWQQRFGTLTVGGQLVNDSTPLNHVTALTVFDIDASLPGGKVHGSLSRAGKVKKQTPKVAKAEDAKKRKTGRAKRRQQYNSRFVNVVAAFGRKRGPNANS